MYHSRAISVTAFTIFASLLLNLAGCGGKSAVPVEGAVTLNDRPLADATVVFAPTTVEGPGPFFGTTDAAGKYALGTKEEPGTGAVAGEYMVMITTVKTDPNANEDTPVNQQREIVPGAYRDGSTRVTVPKEGNTAANFDMTGR